MTEAKQSVRLESLILSVALTGVAKSMNKELESALWGHPGYKKGRLSQKNNEGIVRLVSEDGERTFRLTIQEVDSCQEPS